MPIPLPPGMQTQLNGRITLQHTAWEGIKTSAVRNLHLDLHFSHDYSSVAIGLGWPSITLDNGKPLAPPTHSITFSFQEALLGQFDSAAGEMQLPLKLYVDVEPNGIFAHRDQELEISVSTASGVKLWTRPPEITLNGKADYTIGGDFWGLGGDKKQTVRIFLNGKLSKLPPRALEVSCIRGNKWDGVRAIGGIDERGTRWQRQANHAIMDVEVGVMYFVERPEGDRVNLVVATREGDKYLKTEADGDEPNNLLALPACPQS